MSERPQLQPALGLVKDRLAGPPPRRNPPRSPETPPAADPVEDSRQDSIQNSTQNPTQGSAKHTETSDSSQGGATHAPSVDDQPDSIQTPTSSTGPAAPRRTRKATPARASDASDGGTRRTTVSIPQDLAEALRTRLRTERGVSQAQFILNAIEANAHHLTELVDAERPTPAPGSALFPDQRPTRLATEARTTINFDTTERNLQVVDSLVERHGADSRSQLVRVCLHQALD